MSQTVPNLLPQTIKNVLVTGGAGFIGGTLVKRLLSDNNLQVFNLDKLGYASNLKFLDNNDISKQNYQFLKVDLKNYQEKSIRQRYHFSGWKTSKGTSSKRC